MPIVIIVIILFIYLVYHYYNDDSASTDKQKTNRQEFITIEEIEKEQLKKRTSMSVEEFNNTKYEIFHVKKMGYTLSLLHTIGDETVLNFKIRYEIIRPKSYHHYLGRQKVGVVGLGLDKVKVSIYPIIEVLYYNSIKLGELSKEDSEYLFEKYLLKNNEATKKVVVKVYSIKNSDLYLNETFKIALLYNGTKDEIESFDMFIKNRFENSLNYNYRSYTKFNSNNIKEEDLVAPISDSDYELVLLKKGMIVKAHEYVYKVKNSFLDLDRVRGESLYYYVNYEDIVSIFLFEYDSDENNGVDYISKINKLTMRIQFRDEEGAIKSIYIEVFQSVYDYEYRKYLKSSQRMFVFDDIINKELGSYSYQIRFKKFLEKNLLSEYSIDVKEAIDKSWLGL